MPMTTATIERIIDLTDAVPSLRLRIDLTITTDAEFASRYEAAKLTAEVTERLRSL
jgi:hypothetical protein